MEILTQKTLQIWGSCFAIFWNVRKDPYNQFYVRPLSLSHAGDNFTRLQSQPFCNNYTLYTQGTMWHLFEDRKLLIMVCCVWPQSELPGWSELHVLIKQFLVEITSERLWRSILLIRRSLDEKLVEILLKIPDQLLPSSAAEFITINISKGFRLWLYEGKFFRSSITSLSTFLS